MWMFVGLSSSSCRQKKRGVIVYNVAADEPLEAAEILLLLTALFLGVLRADGRIRH
jgi:hypothetical protein